MMRLIFAKKYNLLYLMLLFSSLVMGQNKEVFCTKTETAPVIDGDMSDSVWQKATPITDFLQQDPIPGVNPRFNTEVRVLYDNDKIYFGVYCYDDNPNEIIAREMKWDGYISKDDYFRIIIDTYNDDRNAYWFAINPLSAQNDALVTGNDFSGFNEDWDGVWEVKAKITEKGWFAEVAYPFFMFRFFDKNEQIWGVNFERCIKRYDEVILWTSVGKDKGSMKISEAGDLRGLNGIKRGTPVYLIPFLSAGMEIKPDRNQYVHEPGLDAKIGLSETMSLDLTLNTDFAQVEADRDKINLSRFPLFFQEKRDFFLEGVNTFKFNMGSSNTLYYSRRMGLNKGEEIPIIGGAKLVGRTGSYEIGLLNLTTDKKGNEPVTNFSVLRTKYDILGHSYIGAIITDKETKNSFNRSIGADFELSFDNFLGDKNLIITSRIAKTFERNNPQNTWAGFFSIDYPNEVIDQYFSYNFYQNNFNPAMGFIDQTGIQQYHYSLKISPRINKYYIRKLSLNPFDMALHYDKNNELQHAYFYTQPIGFVTEGGETFYLSGERVFDNVQKSFVIFDTTEVAAGKYWYTTFYSGIQSSTSNSIYGKLEVEMGEFYNGTKNTYSFNLTSVFNKHLIFEGDFEYNNISINNNKIKTYEFGGRLKYNLSTQWLTSVFCQWNNELDEINLNYRINWKPKLGSDFYLVINHLLDTKNVIKTKDFIILAKFSWLFII